MSMDKYFQWEKMTLADLIVVMVKFMDFDRVEMTVEARPDVASRIWFRLEFERPDQKSFVDGQSIEIVHRRIIELLDSQKMREAWQKQKQSES